MQKMKLKPNWQYRIEAIFILVLILVTIFLFIAGIIQVGGWLKLWKVG